jgi:membrane protein YdbS with pleckstrin-like domain
VDGTVVMAVVAFVVMFCLFVIAPTLVKRKHARQEAERD